MWDAWRLLWSLLIGFFRSRASLEAENLALRQQIIVLRRTAHHQYVWIDLRKGNRAFEFAVERAVFAATLHRLFVSGSDRDCSSWMVDYDIAGVDGLDLHHFYRAMAWLGEELEEQPADALAPRCVKDVIEERLFDQRRDLFTDLSAVFMDTTSHRSPARAARRWASMATRGLSPRPEANDPGPRRRWFGLAALHRDVARQHRRRDDAVAGDRSAAPALRHRPRSSWPTAA